MRKRKTKQPKYKAMDRFELVYRSALCVEKNLCFVSLKPINDNPTQLVYHSPALGYVVVLREYGV